MTLENKIASSTVKHNALKHERLAIERKVVMMRPGSIDRDLLEERARHVLGYRHADDLILLQNRS